MPLILLKTVDDAAKHLRSGHLVIYPTETAYALGADASNKKAVRKVFQVKGRRQSKALPLIVASLTMAERYARFSSLTKQLTKRYWPGPLTIVAPAEKNLLPQSVIVQGGTIALRVSSHRLARSLSKHLRRPIVATSANLSGQGNSYSPRTIRKFFFRSPTTIYFLSAGTLPRCRPSTVVAFKNGRLIVLREGAIRVKGITNQELGIRN